MEKVRDQFFLDGDAFSFKPLQFYWLLPHVSPAELKLVTLPLHISGHICVKSEDKMFLHAVFQCVRHHALVNSKLVPPFKIKKQNVSQNKSDESTRAITYIHI